MADSSAEASIYFVTHPSILCLVVERNELLCCASSPYPRSMHPLLCGREVLESSVLLLIYKEPSPQQAKAVPHLASALVNSNPTFALITDGQPEGTLQGDSLAERLSQLSFALWIG